VAACFPLTTKSSVGMSTALPSRARLAADSVAGAAVAASEEP